MNISQSSNWYIQLPSISVFRVTGKDSTRYLSARLSNDIRGMGRHSICRAAALTAQGKSEGFFFVYVAGDDDYLLVSDGGETSSLLSALKRFLVADRVTIELVDDLWTVIHASQLAVEGVSRNEAFADLAKWAHQKSTAPLVGNKPFTYVTYPAVRCMTTDTIDLLVPKEHVTDVLGLFGSNTELSLTRFNQLRISAGIATFPEDMGDDILFLESGRYDAVSFKKGCYVGQEVLERMDSRGAAPRKLVGVSLNTTSPLPPREPILMMHPNGTRERIGTMYSSVLSSNELVTEALASVRSGIEANTPIEVASIPGTIRELPPWPEHI